MTGNPFEGCWHRIERARTHSNTAAEAWNAFLDDKPYDSRLSHEGEGQHELWIEQLAPVPPILSVLLGELFYNLRAALDYCAYATAISDSESDPPPDDDVVQFPIYESHERFVANQYRIADLSELHRGWLEAIQPYHGDDGVRADGLWWLNELARRDRHRALGVVGAYITESAPRITKRPDQSVHVEDIYPLVFVEGDAVVARFKVTPWAIGDKVEANPNLAMDVEIKEMARQRPKDAGWLWRRLPERIYVISSLVEVIVARFERDCEGWTRSKLVPPEDAYLRTNWDSAE